MVKIVHLPTGIFNLPVEHYDIGLTNLINGLAVLGKKRNYSPEFKLNVIQAVKNGKFSAEAACLHFGIANSGVVSQ